MTWHLCGQAKQGQTRREDLCPGAVVLRGFTTQAPFRHMVTPGGFRMLVAMTNCGACGWVTDRAGYRYDAVDPESGRPWPRMPGVFLNLAHDAEASAGFEGFQLDACLINCYEPGA